MFRNENFVKLEFCLFIGGNIVTNYSFLLVSEISTLIITTKRSFSSTIMIN